MIEALLRTNLQVHKAYIEEMPTVERLCMERGHSLGNAGWYSLHPPENNIDAAVYRPNCFIQSPEILQSHSESCLKNINIYFVRIMVQVEKLLP